jgi:uncharacterized repeat protein (TIGR01451 family)
MKRTWIGTCAVGATLTATLIAQVVWGQAEAPRPLGLPPISNFAETPPARLPEGPALPFGAPAAPSQIPTSPAKSPLLPAGAAPGALAAPVNALYSPPPTPGSLAPPGAPRAELSADASDGRASRQEPAVSVEWVGPPLVRLNQPITCQLVVRNQGTVPVQNVLVRHRLTDSMQLRSSDPQATAEAGELTWALGTLAAGQVKKIDMVMQAQARGAVNCQASVSFTTVAGHQMVVREPLLAVKMRAPDKVVAGENVTLGFTVTNPGDGATDGIKLRATLPEGLEHSRGKVLEVDVGTLAPKESRNLQLVCVAKGSGAQKCVVTATAEGLTVNDTADIEILLPKLDLALQGPKLRYLDRHAVYVLKVSNSGSAPAAGVNLHEAVPAGFKFHSATAGGRFDEATRTVAWALGDLAPGKTCEVAVDLIPTTPGEHRLAAMVTTQRGQRSGAELRTQVEGVPSLLIDLADSDDPVEVGAESAYELRITNNGTKTETNLEVACTLPEQVELKHVKCGADLRYRVEGRELIFEPVARLAPKADIIYRIQVKGKQPGDARLRVRIRADGLREPVLREESTRFYSDDAPLRPGGLPSELKE